MTDRAAQVLRTVWAAAALAALSVAAGCSSGGSSTVPTTEPATSITSAGGDTTTSTEATTTTTFEIVTVPGSSRPTTTIPTDFGPGVAQISGRVVGPNGPVRGARVRIERAVAGVVTARDLTTDSGGTFSLSAILGGRYQVRAWKAPDLAQVEAEAFFLGAEESRNLDLQVERFGSLNVLVSADGDPLPASDPFNVTVLVYSASISAAGEVVASPLIGPEVIITTGEWLAHVGPDRAITNSQGEATFRMRCLMPGGTTGEVFVSGGRFPLGLPTCGTPPATVPPTTGAPSG